MTYCCTQCMNIFEKFEVELDANGKPICPHCETSEYVETFNNEDEE